MTDEDRPQLDDEIWEEISNKSFTVQKRYAKLLALFAQDLPTSPLWRGIGGAINDGLPVAPKQPVHIRRILGNYAAELFDMESAFYPNSDQLPAWRKWLASRIERAVIAHVTNIRPEPVTASNPSRGLTYHISVPEMSAAIHAALKARIEGSKPLPPIISASPNAIAPTPFIQPILQAPQVERSVVSDTQDRKTMTARRTERIALRDAYNAKFSEKIKVLDVCWAAREYYHEWQSWLRGKLKDGSKPDKAFRALLTSGKKPQECRSERRPKNWK
jgi:hypothetical protein